MLNIPEYADLEARIASCRDQAESLATNICDEANAMARFKGAKSASQDLRDEAENSTVMAPQSWISFSSRVGDYC